MKINLKLLAAAGLLAAALLSSCNLPLFGGQTPAESNPGAAQTAAAVQTRSGPSIEATGAALRTPVGGPTGTSTNQPTQTATLVDGGTGCENQADFIDDVSVPDNAEFDRGDTFIKIWRLRNSGTCRWTPAYLLSFIGGSRLNAPSSVSLSTEVPPGELIDLAVDMQAPNDSGTFQGFWKLRSPQGEFFGIGPQGDQSFWVKIVVPAPPTSEISPTVTASRTATTSPTASATVEITATPSATQTPTASNTPTSTATSTPTSSAAP